MPIGDMIRSIAARNQAIKEAKAQRKNQTVLYDWTNGTWMEEGKLGHLVGEFCEKMCDGQVYMGYRFWNLRTVPRSMPLGRPPAPWCLMPWSKRRYRHEQVAMTIGFTDDYYRDVIMRDGQKRGWT